MHALLLQSAKQKEKIMMIYIDKQGQITQRVIRVIDIHSHTILAFCYYRKQVRSFHRNRILSIGQPEKHKHSG